mgnify:CR=1 FL=1
MSRETVIASFIMRFVKPAALQVLPATAPPADGVPPAPDRSEMRIAVRHVQSGYERRFARVDEAMDFIQKEIELLEEEEGVD